jgi:hypothetical protein
MQCFLTLTQICSDPVLIDTLVAEVLDHQRALSTLLGAPLKLHPFQDLPAFSKAGALALTTLLAKHPVFRAGVLHTTKQFPGLLGGLQGALLERLTEVVGDAEFRCVPIVDVFGHYLNSIEFVESLSTTIWEDPVLLENVVMISFQRQEALIAGIPPTAIPFVPTVSEELRQERGPSPPRQSVPAAQRSRALTAAVLTFAMCITFKPLAPVQPPEANTFTVGEPEHLDQAWDGEEDNPPTLVRPLSGNALPEIDPEKIPRRSASYASSFAKASKTIEMNPYLQHAFRSISEERSASQASSRWKKSDRGRRTSSPGASSRRPWR